MPLNYVNKSSLLQGVGVNLNSLIGDRIKEERQRLGLKQTEIAEKAGISREMWGKYERGIAIPGGEVLFSFAAAGADIQYLMTGLRPHTPDLSPRTAALVDNFENMADEDKRAIERLAAAVQKPDTKTGTN